MNVSEIGTAGTACHLVLHCVRPPKPNIRGRQS